MNNKTLSLALLGTFFLVTIASPNPAHAQTPLIETFIGSGAKTAYFVLDFKNGNRYNFGYHYDAPNTTAGDMIVAIDAALPSLVADLGGNRTDSYGRFVNGFGYQGNALSSFPTNFDTPPYTGWQYYVSNSSLNTTTPNWIDSNWGIDGTGTGVAGSDQSLDTYVWNGFSFGTYDTNTFAFQGSAPIVNAAPAPEPTTLAFLILGVVGSGSLLRRRRK